MNITDQFIDGLYEMSQREFSEELKEHARKCLLDYLGVTIAGAKEYKAVEDAFMQSKIAEGDAVTVIGRGEKTSAQTAALVNGISAHAVELDDGHRVGMIHLGAPIISALLAVAEIENIGLQDLLGGGILVGYECATRLACAVQPGHKLKGFHATGPCGTIGAAMAIAAMLKYDKKLFKSALTAACTSASGILEMIEGDTQMMPYNAGKAALSGVVAAYIGKAGFKSPEDALGGKRGFLATMAENPNVQLLTDFSNGYMCNTHYFKQFAACRHCHPDIEAALNIRQQNSINIKDISEVNIETYKMALRGHDHNVIDGVNSARQSIPYSVAVALAKGRAGIDDYSEEAIADRDVLELTSKITVKENPELTKVAPAKRIAKVTIKTKYNIYIESVTYPKGEPENPMTMEDIEDKYYSMSQYADFPSDKAQRIAGVVLSGTGTVRELMKEFF